MTLPSSFLLLQMEATTAAAAAAQFQVFVKGLHRLQLVRTFDLIACTMFVYDWALTLDLEIAMVWKSNWNLMKVLFLIQRYLPFIDTVFLVLLLKFGLGMDNAICKRVYAASGYLMASGTAISELILTLRVWAVWHRDKRLTILLPMVVVGIWVPIMYYMYIFLNSLQFATLPKALLDLHDTQCFIVKADSRFYLVWLLLMIMDAVILFLMMIPGYKAYRAGGDSALYQTVYRDGAIYYLYLFALSTINIVLIRVLPHGYENLLTPIERGVHSMLTSRVLLHIRAHSRGEDQDLASRHWADGVTDLPHPRHDSESRGGFGTTSYKSIVIQRTQVTSERVI
ncbi:hypothetical protein CVT24_001561 [Panaeolus cyanescens]|uniref:DUF6533 domain-containing protein n=1 Tax=Panaeolus cyanescens TaxID=181874 RepID=A0A409YFH2_9AGAR|nr:hypothetical protein CVT24_001561 [Panaeolus cyanescens]